MHGRTFTRFAFSLWEHQFHDLDTYWNNKQTKIKNNNKKVTLAVETCKSSEMRKRCIRCVRILHKAWELSDNDEN